MVENGVPAFHLMAKPAGSQCNCACEYCFYLAKADLYPGGTHRMSDEVHEAYIRQLLEAHHVPQVTVAWQGGEPTLMGLDFFRRSVELQKKYQKPGTPDRKHLPDQRHPPRRRVVPVLSRAQLPDRPEPGRPRGASRLLPERQGGPWNLRPGREAARLLQKHRVEFNILCTVNAKNADHPLEVYRFFRDELGAQYIQFIPIVERENESGFQEGDKVTDRSVRPDQWGRFLIEIFDEWVARDVGKMFRPQLRRRPGRLARDGRDRLHLRPHLRPGDGPGAQRRPVFL